MVSVVDPLTRSIFVNLLETLWPLAQVHPTERALECIAKKAVVYLEKVLARWLMRLKLHRGGVIH